MADAGFSELRLERIGAQVERIDARVCRMERAWPLHARAAAAGDTPEPLRVAVRPRTGHLLDLPAELLVAIAAHLAEDDELAAALACRRLRDAIAGNKRRAAGARLSTSIGSASCSAGKLAWAVLSGGLALSGRLLLPAAGSGHLEQLSWLRALGCAWEPCNGDGKDCCSTAAAGGHLTVLQWARADGCPWDEYTCSKPLRRATCTCFSGLAPTAARGMRRPAGVQLRVGTWLCCSGCMPTAARGMRSRALVQLGVGTWKCCGGCVPMAAPGMRGRAGMLLRVGT
jgi:hypothetical protein